MKYLCLILFAFSACAGQISIGVVASSYLTATPAGSATDTRKSQLTIPHGQVSAGQTNFPLYISAPCLPAEMVTTSGTHAAQADGGDIRFTSDSAGINGLHAEIVFFHQDATPANATAEIWVLMPSISASAPDTSIYVWYHPATPGQTQPAATDATWGSQGVWSNYLLVWHPGDGTDLNLTDSTGTHTLTNGGTIIADSGGIGGSATFIGDLNVDNQITITPTTDLQLASGSIQWGMQLWLKTVNNGAYHSIIGCQQCGISSYPRATCMALVGSNNATWRVTGLSSATWMAFAGQFYGNGPTYSMYLNGTPAGATFSDTGPNEDTGFYGFSYFGYNGSLSEVRIYKGYTLPATWFAAEYTNQNTPTSFVTAGTPSNP